MMFDLVGMLIRHEGKRYKPYLDTAGKWTIGVGRNLSDRGLSESEVMVMLQNDIEESTNECLHAFPWFADLSEARQAVLVDMCFNLGLTKLLQFTKFLRAMELGNYDTAKREMLDSAWAKQVNGRANELATLIIGGTDV